MARLRLDKTPLFRVTHFDNIKYIAEKGITHVSSPDSNENYVPIGNNAIIDKRKERLLPSGRPLTDYIPFHFAPRMPMLYAIQKGYGTEVVDPRRLVYCISTVQQIMDAELEFWFTNGHAFSRLSHFYDSSRIRKIRGLLDWDAITDNGWGGSENTDLRRRKEAEFLVGADVPATCITEYIVYSPSVKDKLFVSGIDDDKIRVEPGYYF
ncbi:uncharacterized protein DUF4433 [Dysgonomonas alginatilytica]|uniref:Uncharacterized protein DUF4433 n=1 Tax=Dysgonomonas alginatilytica TaxID=1605892 RepID=A0A2V3PWN9_9BACT|nr:DUF4433 domain-containing protein [Dysgonomonas alginatilytica]PXV69204.1 uncharacterized protein DUF4433 [Dysgonomonas alginatilytica]